MAQLLKFKLMFAFKKLMLFDFIKKYKYLVISESQNKVVVAEKIGRGRGNELR